MSRSQPATSSSGSSPRPDEDVGRDPVAPEAADRLVPRGLVGRHRDRCLARHPPAADVVVQRLDVDADGRGAGLGELGDHREVVGRFALDLDGEPGNRVEDGPHTSGEVARASVRCRRRAGRQHHLADAVEAHRGLGHLGELRRGLHPRGGPGLERRLDGAEPAPGGLGVADAGLDDRAGEHVGAVQPGELLVGDAVGGPQVVEPGAIDRLGREAHVDAVEQQAPVDDLEGAGGVEGQSRPRPPRRTWPSSLGPAPARRRTGGATRTPWRATAARRSTSDGDDDRVRHHVTTCRWS